MNNIGNSLFTFHFSLFTMLLTIDIGNTNTTFGVFDSDNLTVKWRLSTVRDRTSDEIGVLLRQFFSTAGIDYQKVHAIIASSVVPQLDFAFQQMSEKYLGHSAIFVNHTFDFGFKINYNPPSSVGIDRFVDAFAAVHKYGKPCIVCDFGTATTIDAVDSKSEYLGGIIVPGMNVLADALFQKTAKLPKVEIKKPESVFGTSTAGSIQSGIYFGYIGLVDEILRRMADALGEKPNFIATGGFASLIAESSDLIEITDENLMLEGLRLIYEKMNTDKN
ncbi:MAG: type III pantothenate kinase [Acidobacteriota bacterium]|nr:type III pantothenate kinase [Acidobacteriota bacterium]